MYEDTATRSHALVVDLLGNVQPNCNVVLVGHSLGASLAEASLVRLQSDHNETRLFTAFTFDSPGQPQYWRALMGIVEGGSVRDLTTYNGPANIISMLNRPIAARLLSCGLGVNVPLNVVVRVVSEWALPIWNGLKSLTIDMAITAIGVFAIAQRRSHDIDNLADLIQNGVVYELTRNEWTPVSSISLMIAFYAYENVFTKGYRAFRNFFRPNLVREPRVPEPLAPEPRPRHVRPVPPGPDPGIELIPENRGDFVKYRPYVLARVDADSEEVINCFEAFHRMLNVEADAVVVLVGMTNGGKSSVFKALCQGAAGIDISALPNETLIPNIAYIGDGRVEHGVQGRVFAIDMPGWGAAEAPGRDHRNLLITNSVAHLVERFRHLIGALIWCQNGIFHDFSFEFFVAACSACGGAHTLIVQSDATSLPALGPVGAPAPPTEADQVNAALRISLNDPRYPGFNDIRIIRARLFYHPTFNDDTRRTSRHNSDYVVDEIQGFLALHFNDIQLRMQNEAREREERERARERAAGGNVPDESFLKKIGRYAAMPVEFAWSWFRRLLRF